jgi:hypothetical protein
MNIVSLLYGILSIRETYIKVVGLVKCGQSILKALNGLVR